MIITTPLNKYDFDLRAKAPSRIYEAIEQDGWETYWERVDDKSKITIPEYIEARAKGLGKEMYGHYYRKITVAR